MDSREKNFLLVRPFENEFLFIFIFYTYMFMYLYFEKKGDELRITS